MDNNLMEKVETNNDYDRLSLICAALSNIAGTSSPKAEAERAIMVADAVLRILDEEGA